MKNLSLIYDWVTFKRLFYISKKHTGLIEVPCDYMFKVLRNEKKKSKKMARNALNVFGECKFLMDGAFKLFFRQHLFRTVGF